MSLCADIHFGVLCICMDSCTTISNQGNILKEERFVMIFFSVVNVKETCSKGDTKLNCSISKTTFQFIDYNL